jgi:hypothetical protein
MIASGKLPAVVPTVQQLLDAAHAGNKVDGATMDGVNGGGDDVVAAGAGDGGDGGGDGGNDTSGGEGGEPLLLYNATAALEVLMQPKEVVLLAHRADGSGVIDRVPLGSYALVRRDVRRSGGWKVCKYQQAVGRWKLTHINRSTHQVKPFYLSK